MRFIYKDFKELNAPEVEQMFKLRQNVFIIEQDCIYPDIDGWDQKARHLLMYDNSILIGYLRIFPRGVKFDDATSIGRIIIGKSYRGGKAGNQLIKKGIELCDPEDIRIEAQHALESYYLQYGFKPVGSPYVVDGIDHIEMFYSR